jgi:hypothetical protein
MANNAYFTTRQCGVMSVYSHAMSCDMRGIICGIRPRMLAPLTAEFGGISVPISRGGPPVLNE